jgi:hypothetical protein
MPAAKGNPEAEPVECVANCDFVSERVCSARVVTLSNFDLVALYLKGCVVPELLHFPILT